MHLVTASEVESLFLKSIVLLKLVKDVKQLKETSPVGDIGDTVSDLVVKTQELNTLLLNLSQRISVIIDGSFIIT